MPRNPKAKKKQKEKKAKASQNSTSQKPSKQAPNNSKASEKAKKKESKRERKQRMKKEYEELKKNLEQSGYYVREMGGDGNCLFRSVSDQIEGNENNFKYYRQICCEFMKNNKEQFKPFIDDSTTIERYIEKMSKNKEWGGNLEINALSNALEANFYIYDCELKKMLNNKIFDKPKHVITILYYDGSHYNSLRKLSEITKEELENKNKHKDDESSEESSEDEDDLNEEEEELQKKFSCLEI